jgi:hypothetical protein
LLITVTLLAFLVLLLVSLASLTRVETQVASNSQQLVSARQNALMALNIALGELQKYAGPDQRATARADIQETSATPPVNGAKRWTGVWGNTANPQADLTSSPKLLQWLVSGSHNTGFNPVNHVSVLPASFGQIATTAVAPAVKPDLAITGGLTTSASVSTPLQIAGDDAMLLVGPATAGAQSGAEKDYVVAPLVDIKVSPASIPGAGTSGSDVTIGRYAYWVGDEGVKARVNGVDPYVAPTAQMSAAGVTADEDSLFRLMAPQRLGIEQIPGYASFPVNEAELRNVLVDEQVGLVDSSLTPEVRQARFHDLTTTSESVLADQLHGGLKRDLTFAFARNDLNQYQATLRDPLRTISAGAPNPLLSGVRSAAYNVADTTLISEQGPTWEQLRSYARLGAVMDKDASGNDRITPRIQTGTEHGIYPILVQARLGFGGHATAVDATNARFVNHFYPSFVLANPYNVTIKGDKYRVRALFGSGKYSVYIGGTPGAHWEKSLRALFDGAQFELDCPDLKPGEARVFTLDSGSPDVPWQESKIYPMSNEWDAGFARIVVPVDVDIPRTAIEGDPALGGRRLGVHPIFSSAGDQSWRGSDNQPWTAVSPGEPALTGGTNTTADPMGWVLTNQSDEVYQRFDNYPTPAGGTRIHQQGYKGALPIQSGPQSYLLFRLAESGNFGGKSTTGNYYTQVGVYPYYALGNIRAPMVSRPSWYTGKNIYSTLLFSSGFEQNASSSSTPTFAHWIRLDASGSGYERVEWQGLRKADQQASLDQARMQWAPADVPRQPDGLISGIVSVGQLQHFNAGGYNDGWTIPAVGSAIPFSPRPPSNGTWRPRFADNPNPIGNSRANPFIQRDKIREVRNGEPFYDQSYLLNRQLFDGYFFSSYPQEAAAVDLRTDRLANSNMVSFRREVAPNDPEQFRGGATFNADQVFLTARNLMQKGAFNVNSTSVAAWTAVLGAFAGTEFNGENNLMAPFVRSVHQSGGSGSATDGVSENAWNGFRNLTSAQVTALATAIVDQIKQRGVSVSVSDFINRKLVADTASNAADGLNGPLQAAIDTAAINTEVASMQDWNGAQATISTLTTHAVFPYPQHLPKHALEGIAGWLTQADVVQALAPILNARSDTFRIRTYGETRNPVTDEVVGRAWCEAIVQRMPDYVDSAANDAIAAGYSATPPGGVALTDDNARFGRKFVVVGFRWLNPQDI